MKYLSLSFQVFAFETISAIEYDSITYDVNMEPVGVSMENFIKVDIEYLFNSIKITKDVPFMMINSPYFGEMKERTMIHSSQKDNINVFKSKLDVLKKNQIVICLIHNNTNMIFIYLKRSGQCVINISFGSAAKCKLIGIEKIEGGNNKKKSCNGVPGCDTLDPSKGYKTNCPILEILRDAFSNLIEPYMFEAVDVEVKNITPKYFNAHCPISDLFVDKLTNMIDVKSLLMKMTIMPVIVNEDEKFITNVVLDKKQYLHLTVDQGTILITSNFIEYEKFPSRRSIEDINNYLFRSMMIYSDLIEITGIGKLDEDSVKDMSKRKKAIKVVGGGRKKKEEVEDTEGTKGTKGTKGVKSKTFNGENVDYGELLDWYRESGSKTKIKNKKIYLLQSVDPILYNFHKSINSEDKYKPYSAVCQQFRQPAVYSTREDAIDHIDNDSYALEAINMSYNNKKDFYVCKHPSKKYPGLIDTTEHPFGYRMKCCFSKDQRKTGQQKRKKIITEEEMLGNLKKSATSMNQGSEFNNRDYIRNGYKHGKTLIPPQLCKIPQKLHDIFNKINEYTISTGSNTLSINSNIFKPEELFNYLISSYEKIRIETDQKKDNFFITVFK